MRVGSQPDPRLGCIIHRLTDPENNMQTDGDKNQIISDYTAFLKALSPQTRGFCCHDRRGQLFWEEQGADRGGWPDAYEPVLREILETPGKASEVGRVGAGPRSVYILPLTDNEQRLIGALSVFVDTTQADMGYAEFCAQVQPAVRSLERELTLRYRLVSTYRQLSVRSAEENLLHQVEKLVHLRRPCEKTLGHVLLLCLRFLNIKGAGIFIPERQIRLFEGDAIRPAQAQLLLSEMAERASASAADADVEFDTDLDTLALPVCQEKKMPLGVLVLSGWEKSDFSARRRKRIARYVVALIEDVIAHDYDSLTGLMSWSLFEEQLIESGKRSVDGDLYCLYFDIDQMHVINETFGTEKGDEILVSFAKLLRERLGSSLITRISGDRFTALMVGMDVDGVRVHAEGISRRFNELEYVRDDQTLRPTVSVGIGPVSGESKLASAALAPAQVACQAAKERGRGRVESFQQGDASIIQRLDDIHLVGHIRNAIENDRLMLMVQPIVAIQDQKTTYYYEVLVRLINAAGGHVMPADFFSAAERYQLMEDLDRLVVTKTLKMISERMKDLRELPLHVAINLSGQSLSSAEFLPFVRKQIEKYAVPGKMLCFEVTETVAVANLQRAQHFMHTMKTLGCRFSLDDFGTGLSSFAYLKLFPVDTLKIDGSFVHDIATNVTSQSVVAAIVEVARVMGLETVGEYVQDEKSMALLKDLGVTWGQGFLLGAPEPLADKLNSLTLHSGVEGLLAS
jgi:diguanylate cyclase (GGDEF)-like protein